MKRIIYGHGKPLGAYSFCNEQTYCYGKPPKEGSYLLLAYDDEVKIPQHWLWPNWIDDCPEEMTYKEYIFRRRMEEGRWHKDNIFGA